MPTPFRSVARSTALSCHRAADKVPRPSRDHAVCPGEAAFDLKLAAHVRTKWRRLRSPRHHPHRNAVMTKDPADQRRSPFETLPC